MKIFKKLGKAILIICSILIILIVVSSMNHIYQLKREAKEYLAPGKLVEVNNHKMHVYGEGQGDFTLVFMSGSGTSYPTLDFKSLWMKMVDQYRIVVVEKAGYGWSDIAPVSRDIDTMLEETRKSLELTGEEAPYILVPHSMSALEAIYWAQKYPHEVKAIIGMDPAIPEVYETLPIPGKAIQGLAYFAARTGLLRFVPSVVESSSAIKSQDLSKEEKEEYKAMFYKSTLTKNMLDEADYVLENAKKVKKIGVPIDTPMYFFISDGKEVGMVNWKELLSNYVLQIHYGKYKYLESGHYVHNEKTDIIANEMKAFIEEINKY